jgi:hypothetical protein
MAATHLYLQHKPRQRRYDPALSAAIDWLTVAIEEPAEQLPAIRAALAIIERLAMG